MVKGGWGEGFGEFCKDAASAKWGGGETTEGNGDALLSKGISHAAILA